MRVSAKIYRVEYERVGIEIHQIEYRKWGTQTYEVEYRVEVWKFTESGMVKYENLLCREGGECENCWLV